MDSNTAWKQAVGMAAAMSEKPFTLHEWCTAPN